MISDVILNNLINVGYGVALFILAYLSNMLFSIWYNIKVLLQPFDLKKIRDSGIKILCFGAGLTLLSLGISILPEFANTVGWEIPEEFKEVFADIAIIGVFLLVTTKYLLESWNKMKVILFSKIEPKIEQ